MLCAKEQLISERLPLLRQLLNPCRLCPRNCGVDRLHDKQGFCRIGGQIRVASWAQHRGEEPPISGSHGSGAIFASGCTLGCFFCQNFPFSQLGNGQLMSADELGAIYSRLARNGIHNLNFVTPTHVLPMLLEAWLCSDERAKALPLVYNCSGYESAEVIDLLDGIVDIWLPDIKYSQNSVAAELSNVSDYVEVNRRTLRKMWDQVGLLQVDPTTGIASRGMIIRHLVLPQGLAGSADSLLWLRQEFGADVFLSVMSQYFPAYKAFEHPIMSRSLEPEEYIAVLDLIEELGFTNVWAQDPTERGGA
ncbi:MAG: radical SAM protein [Candidatus Riflebacteria bacterium]|nr:radical SAM protein [Candidatus Riflebacteria bacterium]